MGTWVGCSELGMKQGHIRADARFELGTIKPRAETAMIALATQFARLYTRVRRERVTKKGGSRTSIKTPCHYPKELQSVP